ncbi:MAG: hypothetical protein EHM61_11630 [Acidobacteria bacterium]|nr:MAG: hypothetical protein EHM61_11630 [Acidobacteriota bacterium]
MAVATRRHPKDPADVVKACHFATDELVGAGQIVHGFQINSRRGRNAVEVGVITDLMPAKGLDHVLTPSLFEDSGFLSDDFERGFHPQFAQIGRKPQGGIVGRRFDVVFGVKPKNDVDRAIGGDGD